MAESIAEEPSAVTTVEIRVRTLDSSNYTVRVNKDLPVPALKDQLAPVVGVPPQNQRLICRGRVLKDDQLLSSYNVEDGHTLHLVPRPAPASSDDANQTTQEPAGTSYGPRHAQITHSLLLGTINIPEASEGGGLPDLNRILSAVINSVGSANAGDRGRGVAVMQVHSGAPASSGVSPTPAENNSSARRQAAASSNTADPYHFRNLEVAPDALTTISHYITRMEQLFTENGYTMPSPFGASLLSLFSNAPSTPGALGATINRVQELLQCQAFAAFTHLAGQLANENMIESASERAALQSTAVWSGGVMQQLGALLLELGRTTMTLRLGPSSAQAVVNSGPAVFVSQSGPNPMMVQPLPFSFSSLHGETASASGTGSSQRNPNTADISRRSFAPFFSNPLFQQNVLSTDAVASAPETNATEAAANQTPEAVRTADQDTEQQGLLLVQDNGSVRIVQMPARGRPASGTPGGGVSIHSTIQTGFRGLRAAQDSAIAVPVLGIRAQVHTEGWTQAVLQASEGQRPVGIALTIPVDVAASQAGENAEQQAPATTSGLDSVVAAYNDSRTQREEATTVQNSGQADQDGAQSSRIEDPQKMEVDQNEDDRGQRKRAGEELSVNGGEESSITSHSKDSQSGETKRQKV